KDRKECDIGEDISQTHFPGVAQATHHSEIGVEASRANETDERSGINGMQRPEDRNRDKQRTEQQGGNSNQAVTIVAIASNGIVWVSCQEASNTDRTSSSNNPNDASQGCLVAKEAKVIG